MGHGGKRIGAGRKVGQLTKRTRAIAEQVAATGKSPLEVMLDNMWHFQQVAIDAEKVLEGLTADEFKGQVSDMTPEEQFKELMAQVKKAAGFRQMAHECARDAASYIHPKLTAVQHSGDLNIKTARDVTDDELANIAARGSQGAAEAPVNPTKLN